MGVVGDYSFQFLMEEIAVACQYKVPYVLVMLTTPTWALYGKGEIKYDMNYAVDIGYEGPENEYGIDNVKVMEAMGALGRRVERPEDIGEGARLGGQGQRGAAGPGARGDFVRAGDQRCDGPSR